MPFLEFLNDLGLDIAGPASTRRTGVAAAVGRGDASSGMRIRQTMIRQLKVKGAGSCGYSCAQS